MHRNGHAIIIALALAAGVTSSCSKKPPPPVTSLPSDDERAAHYATADRIVTDFIDGDRVVSREADGTPEHVGDGLIWSGVTLAGLPCDRGEEWEARLAASIAADGGSLSRHPSLPDSVSIDGALGLYRGVVERSVRCGRGDVWRDAMAAHLDLVERTGGRLNARGQAVIALDFIAVARLAALAAGVEGVHRPTETELGRLEAEAISWAKLVAGKYAAWKAAPGKVEPPACFRVHLAYLALRTMERAGAGVSSSGRASFCETVRFADLPLVEHWCGRGDLLSWIHDFQPDVYEYRHQRCAEYETPDGRPGLRTPGVDKLIAERERFLDL